MMVVEQLLHCKFVCGLASAVHGAQVLTASRELT